jgi:beta-aspartyl-dipeptidase (metallo-type)
VGLLGTDDLTRSVSSLIAQTYALREEGLSAWCYCGGYHVPPATVTGSVRGDIVHIDCVIGVGELAIADHRSSQPTFDQLAGIAGEAHVAGLMTGKAGIVHLHMGDGKRGLALVRQVLDETELPARVFNPTHCNRNPELFEQACALVARGCSIDLTAFPNSEAQSATDRTLPASRALQQYLDAGLPVDKITISSDGGGCLPEFDPQGELLHMDFGRPATLAETLKNLLDAGMDPAAVLPAFSSNVASLLRLRRKGRISLGNDADLVVLDDQYRVSSVMVNGAWHRLNHEQIIHGTFEKAGE